MIYDTDLQSLVMLADCVFERNRKFQFIIFTYLLINPQNMFDTLGFPSSYFT